MHIAIEARALSAQGGGVRTYTYELIRHLLPLSDADSYSLIYDSAIPLGTFPKAHEEILAKHHEALMPLWLQWQVAPFLKKLQPAVAHFTKADVPAKKAVPTVVTIYDIIPLMIPQSQSRTRRWYWPRALRRAATHADHIITISEASKRDLVNHLQVSPDKITVTPLAVDTQRFMPVGHAQPPGTPYILFVGTRDGRKNVAALVRAFAQIASEIPHQLWISGGQALKQDHAAEIVDEMQLRDRVKLFNFVPRPELPTLYAGADLFVYPSVYEGWGFPPQEAMACGTPVIVSNGGALPEVVGEAAEVVPLNEDFDRHLAQTMLRVLTDPVKQKRMREAGLQQVQKFSWRRVAEVTRQVYNKVI